MRNLKPLKSKIIEVSVRHEAVPAMPFISKAIRNILRVTTTAFLVCTGTSLAEQEQQTTTTTTVRGLNTASSSSSSCSIVTVSGFPITDSICIQDVCGGCSAYASDLNGEYVLITDVKNQMVDPLDNSKGGMPVYVKKVESGGNAGVSFFLYYEPFGAYSLNSSGSAESWAIGPSIGSICTDDWGYCRCGHSPPACCSIGPSCASWFAKQKLSPGQESGVACLDVTSYDDRMVNSDFAANPTLGTWEVNQKTTSFYAGRCSSRTTPTDALNVAVACSSTSSTSISSIVDGAPLPYSVDPVITTSSDSLNLEQRVCALGSPESADDCRQDRCQGCRRDYSPSGCDVTVDSCQCSSNNSGGGSPTAFPSTSCQQLTDDPSFFFKTKKKNCRWIGKRAKRKKRLCSKKIKVGQDTNTVVRKLPVSTFCPEACGVCN